MSYLILNAQGHKLAEVGFKVTPSQLTDLCSTTRLHTLTLIYLFIIFKEFNDRLKGITYTDTE